MTAERYIRAIGTFVLVHGAWSGAHAFRHVRRQLHSAGHDAFTARLTIRRGSASDRADAEVTRCARGTRARAAQRDGHLPVHGHRGLHAPAQATARRVCAGAGRAPRAAAHSVRRARRSGGGHAGRFLCRSFVPRSSANLNLAEFCNPRIDAEFARARVLEVADPGAASRLWTKVDHDIVEEAPFVFLQNPRQVTLVSRRVRNYQYNPQWGVLLDQLWVR